MAEWHWIGSSQHPANRPLPSIEGSDRLASSRDEAVIELHPSGWSDTGVVQVAWNWRIGSPLTIMDIHREILVSSGSSVTQ